VCCGEGSGREFIWVSTSKQSWNGALGVSVDAGAAYDVSGACTLAVGVAACAGFNAKASRTATMVQLYAILR
jgi:hypothetical protein